MDSPGSPGSLGSPGSPVEDGELRKRYVKAQCELQEALTEKGAYMKKLKERTAELREKEKASARLEERVRELEGMLKLQKDKSESLERTIQDFVQEQELAAEEGAPQLVTANEAFKPSKEPGRTSVPLLNLKEVVADLDASQTISNPLERIAKLEEENRRLVDLVMEIKRTQAETMNDVNESDRIARRRIDADFLKSPPKKDLHSPRPSTPRVIEAKFKHFVSRFSSTPRGERGSSEACS